MFKSQRSMRKSLACFVVVDPTGHVLTRESIHLSLFGFPSSDIDVDDEDEAAGKESGATAADAPAS